ncbi:MAG: class IV adenylate cyclase [Chloroflexota bacterium]
MSKEIEVKLYYDDLSSLEETIQANGGDLVQDRIYERNIRYDRPDGSMTSKGVVLRLREDNAVKLTYKEPGIIERGIITREELEVEVGDFDTMQAILGKFGYYPSMLYEKYRTIYACHGAHIMLDELPYGNFVEIEGSKDAIEMVINKLGLDHVERRDSSYAKLFDYVKHHLELSFQDLTFENFEDINVPESAFIAPGSIVIR